MDQFHERFTIHHCFATLVTHEMDDTLLQAALVLQ